MAADSAGSTDALDALDRHGPLYTARSRTADVVHVSEECARSCSQEELMADQYGQATDRLKTIKHAPQLPLRADVCYYCDPATDGEPRAEEGDR